MYYETLGRWVRREWAKDTRARRRKMCAMVDTAGVPGSLLARALLASTSCFFFQAEDGIRDDLVTGVQTCALPISFWNACRWRARPGRGAAWRRSRARSRPPPWRRRRSRPALPAPRRCEPARTEYSEIPRAGWSRAL